MLNETGENGELYPVRCPECGEKIENKFFPLDNLLLAYSSGGKMKQLVEFMGIGALYGKPILPQVPPFLDAKQSWNFKKPADSAFADTKLEEFAFDAEEKLTNIQLNIASVVAQFCISSGFSDIYPMLALRKQMNDAADNGMELTQEQDAQWAAYCDSIVLAPGVKKGGLAALGTRNKKIGDILTDILAFAEDEEKQKTKSFAVQQLQAGWCYRVENGRRVPYKLVVRGAAGGIFDCGSCCCSSCRRPLDWELGAYRQKVVGILGTQAVGKTTYLTTLADVVQDLKFEEMAITHNSGDPQWDRIEKEETGILWRYRKGFAPMKTAVAIRAAPALTYKVAKDKASEPVMLTMADIPGEAFDEKQKKAFSQENIDAVTKLLCASDYLILVINAQQLKNAEKTAEETAGEVRTDNLVKDASLISTSMKDFIPKKPISTAVVLTASDKLEGDGGDLRKTLGLAFDVRKLPAMVHSEKEKKYVYNAEAMQTASRAVEDYIDTQFGQCVHNLRTFLPEGSQLAAFAVSNGTQHAENAFYERPASHLDPEGAKKYDEDAAERYKKICDSRFGVEAPLLWLLACDGLLTNGRSDETFAPDALQLRNLLSRKEL